MTTGFDLLTSAPESEHVTTTGVAFDSDHRPHAVVQPADRHEPVRTAVAVACLLGTQFLHWRVIDQHAQEWRAAGVFFFLLALVEGWLTVLLITRRRPAVVAATILASVLPLMIWTWDRTLGLPFGPTKGVRGTIGRSDAMSVVFEVLTIVALWPCLTQRGQVAKRARVDATGRIVIIATCVYVAGFSAWAMIGDQSAIHHPTSPSVTTITFPTQDGGSLNSGIPRVPSQSGP